MPVVAEQNLDLVPTARARRDRDASALPPVEGLFFYDAGLAWDGGMKVSATRPANYDLNTQRYPLRSYGFGVRLNVFGFLILRWDYAKPLDAASRKGFGTWSFGPSF